MENNQFTFEQFSDSGRFTDVNVYLEKNPDAVLHKKCTDVIVYSVSGCCIQVVKTIDSSEFYFNEEIRGSYLDDVELELFTKKLTNN
jgi:penicillin-binding protein-related factor A (putative recombinase)